MKYATQEFLYFTLLLQVFRG